MPHIKNLINIRMIFMILAAIVLILTLASTMSAARSAITKTAAHSDNVTSSQDLTVLKHKLFLDENSTDFDDGLDAVEYEYSQKAKEAAYANAKLAEMKAYAAGGDQ